MYILLYVFYFRVILVLNIVQIKDRFVDELIVRLKIYYLMVLIGKQNLILQLYIYQISLLRRMD